jgi:hypothetical protein
MILAPEYANLILLLYIVGFVGWQVTTAAES